MEKFTKKLLVFFLILILCKIILSFFIHAPSVFSDEYVYSKLARSIWINHDFSVHNIAINQQLPLYPFLLSWLYLFQKIPIIYFSIKVLNTVLLSSLVFPVFFLAKEFVEEKNAFFAAILISFLPVVFVTSFYIMAENLFYLLAFWWVFLLYKSFKERNKKYFILSGFLLGLSFLTKFNGLVLVPVCLFVYLLYKENNLKNITIYYTVALLTVLPWLIRNGLIFGFNLGGLVGQYGTSAGKLQVNLTQLLLPFFNWLLLYSVYLLLASGILFGVCALLSMKIDDKELKLLTTIILTTTAFFVISAANQSSSFRIFFESPFSFFTQRPIGRYVEAILPSLVLLGFISCEKLKIQTLSKKCITFLSFFFLAASQLTIAPLFPFNNSSLSFFGAIKYISDILFTGSFVDTKIVYGSFFVLAAFLSLLPWIFLKKNNWKKLILCFFLLSSLLACAVTYQNGKIWYHSEQMQLGLEIEKLEGKIVLFDERDCKEKLYKEEKEGICELSKKATITGFWVNKEIKIGDVYTEKADLIISKHRLNMKTVKDINDEIFVYQS